MTTQRKPCAECPFARKTPPGDTGGTPPHVYVGQACGPFFLPCHMDPKYKEDRRSIDLLQCAGAAIYRANTGVSDLMPPTLLHLVPDTELVFANPAELIAHHSQTPILLAMLFLMEYPPEVLLKMQLKAQGVQVHLIKRSEEE